jgi:hypothetical protein
MIAFCSRNTQEHTDYVVNVKQRKRQQEATRSTGILNDFGIPGKRGQWEDIIRAEKPQSKNLVT